MTENRNLPDDKNRRIAASLEKLSGNGNQHRIPQDRRLIQESLEKIGQGPQALMHWAAENYRYIDQEFINLLRKMIEYARQTPEHGDLLPIFEFLERCFCKMFDFSESETISVTKDNFKAHLSKAIALLKQAKPDQALHILRALSLFTSQHSEIAYQPQLYANMGIAHAQLHNREKAIEYLHKACQLSNSEQQKQEILSNLGTVYRDNHDLNQARQHHQQALEIADKLEQPQMRLVHLNNLALVQLDSGNAEQAMSLQEQAYAIAKQLGNARVLQDSLTRLAVLSAIAGDVDRCREMCKQGLALAPDKPDANS